MQPARFEVLTILLHARFVLAPRRRDFRLSKWNTPRHYDGTSIPTPNSGSMICTICWSYGNESLLWSRTVRTSMPTGSIPVRGICWDATNMPCFSLMRVLYPRECGSPSRR